MSDAWSKAKGMADQHGGSALFVRLANDGDKVVGIFLGEPYPREVVWTGERYVDADAPEAKATLDEGRKPSLRVAINLYVPAEKAVKIWEMGTVVFKDLLKLREKYGLEKWSFEIERHGASGDPKTTYSLLPEQRIDDDDKKELASLKLHDLQQTVAGAESDDGFDSYDAKNGNDPIDAKVVDKMMPRLKALPREMLNSFLGKFDVKRVKDLKASDVRAALELLDALEAKARPQPDEEVDPFA